MAVLQKILVVRILHITWVGIFLLFCFNLGAQFNIHGGINAAAVRASDGVFSTQSSARLAYHFGVSYWKPLSEKFSYAPGLYYNSKGVGFGFNDIKVNYLESTHTFIYHNNPNNGFFGEVGPYLAFLLNATNRNEDITDDYESVEMGLMVGAGFDLGRILLGGRGSLGLTDIFQDNPQTTSEIRTVNTVGQLYIAFQL